MKNSEEHELNVLLESLASDVKIFIENGRNPNILYEDFANCYKERFNITKEKVKKRIESMIGIKLEGEAR